MNRYFLKFNGETPLFSKEQIHHIRVVLRSKIGEKIQLVDLDTSAVFTYEIISFTPFDVKIVEKVENIIKNIPIIRLLYVLPKGDKLDLVVQKATEIGVDEIVLLTSERCIVKLDEQKASKRLVRYLDIALEASQQSKRTTIPKISGVFPLSSLVKLEGTKLIAYENENNNYLLNKIDEKSGIINILVGPEGGFSSNEVNNLVANGFISVSLGDNILRSETAAIVSVALIKGYFNQRSRYGNY